MYSENKWRFACDVINIFHFRIFRRSSLLHKVLYLQARSIIFIFSQKKSQKLFPEHLQILDIHIICTVPVSQIEHIATLSTLVRVVIMNGCEAIRNISYGTITRVSQILDILICTVQTFKIWIAFAMTYDNFGLVANIHLQKVMVSICSLKIVRMFECNREATENSKKKHAKQKLQLENRQFFFSSTRTPTPAISRSCGEPCVNFGQTI